jgi:hypothetical protein
MDCDSDLKELRDSINTITYKSSVLLEEFIDEEEIEGQNIIFKKNKDKQLMIHYISIDLLLKKVALNELNEHINLNHIILGFLIQYSCFIKFEVLVQKIFLIFDYFRLGRGGEIFYPEGVIKLLNGLILAYYEEQNMNLNMNMNSTHSLKDNIDSSQEIKSEIKSFYEKLLLDEETYNHFSKEEIKGIHDIFNQESKYDVEYSIKQIKGRKKSSGIVTFKSVSNIPKIKSEIFNILEWDEAEIARQMTLTSNKLFSKIEYKELLNSRWTKKDKNKLAPNVLNLIDRFNKLSLWMIEEILSYDKKRMRAATIEKFIRVACECKNLNNFNDCVNITQALNMYIVKKLEKTWKVLNPEVIPLFENLQEICSYDMKYKRLRDEMKNCIGKPCVPYLGVLLNELASLEEGPKYLKNDCLVNIDKICCVYKAIEFFFKFKSQAYLFRPVDELALLSDLQPKSEEELEALADKIGKKTIY